LLSEVKNEAWMLIEILAPYTSAWRHLQMVQSST